MVDQLDKQKILFEVIGSPFVQNTSTLPSADVVDELFEYSFENRVALLFLEKYLDAGGALNSEGEKNLKNLRKRRSDTDAILKKVTHVLNMKYENEWVFFKTLKPFPSTPNDTDWFPFDVSKHKEMCDHLLENGFSFLEVAPLQTTLIENSGIGTADSDKRGGVWYIDCYKQPGADHFIYLNPSKLRKYLINEKVDGVLMPNLDSVAELIAICFHNVFPERVYSIETFYLILHYIEKIDSNNSLAEFVSAARDNNVVRAVSANITITQELHYKYFGIKLQVLDALLKELNSEVQESLYFKNSETLPYDFSIGCFWRSFFEKLKDPLSLRSLFTQALHMLNPVFFWGVVKILKQRLSKGGTYKQM